MKQEQKNIINMRRVNASQYRTMNSGLNSCDLDGMAFNEKVALKMSNKLQEAERAFFNKYGYRA